MTIPYYLSLEISRQVFAVHVWSPQHVNAPANTRTTKQNAWHKGFVATFWTLIRGSRFEGGSRASGPLLLAAEEAMANGVVDHAMPYRNLTLRM
jgi:hypothetical protein